MTNLTGDGGGGGGGDGNQSNYSKNQTTNMNESKQKSTMPDSVSGPLKVIQTLVSNSNGNSGGGSSITKGPNNNNNNNNKMIGNNYWRWKTLPILSLSRMSILASHSRHHTSIPTSNVVNVNDDNDQLDSHNSGEKKDSSNKNTTANNDSTIIVSDEEINRIVNYLLEKMNDCTEKINQLSAEKETCEVELRHVLCKLSSQQSMIRQTCGRRSLVIMEQYFLKQYQMSQSELDLNICTNIQSDMEDELNITQLTIEKFDHLEGVRDLWWRAVNLVHNAHIGGQLAKNLQPPPPPSTEIIHEEIVQKMRDKREQTCERLSLWQVHVDGLHTRYRQECKAYEQFYQKNCRHLNYLLPYREEYVNLRINVIKLDTYIKNLDRKIDYLRSEHSAAMNTLEEVSEYIHQFIHHQSSNVNKKNNSNSNECQPTAKDVEFMIDLLKKVKISLHQTPPPPQEKS